MPGLTPTFTYFDEFKHPNDSDFMELLKSLSKPNRNGCSISDTIPLYEFMANPVRDVIREMVEAICLPPDPLEFSFGPEDTATSTPMENLYGIR
jgi:hypothetical protein